jgi:hypothetical protein
MFGIRDPEYEIWEKPIPDPGSSIKKAPDSGSGSATLEKVLHYLHIIVKFHVNIKCDKIWIGPGSE